jgi:hypothetical protein
VVKACPQVLDIVTENEAHPGGWSNELTNLKAVFAVAGVRLDTKGALLAVDEVFEQACEVLEVLSRSVEFLPPTSEVGRLPHAY